VVTVKEGMGRGRCGWGLRLNAKVIGGHGGKKKKTKKKKKEDVSLTALIP
jgi:hypothetical protein